jgi:PPOX class probable F420-dependent enzyme
MSRRAETAMSAAEAAEFLAGQPTVTCATLGRDGRPHLMPLWYVVRDGELWAWTFAKSQKVRNLERDPRCTLQVEAGVVYDELRGVMLRCIARIHRDTDVVEALGLEIMRRYHADGELAPEVVAVVRRQAPKRVALQFVEDGRRASWDHRKLARPRQPSP